MLNLTSSSNPATTPSAEARQRRLYDIPSASSRRSGRIRSHRPDETSACGLRLRWHPAPIFQTYSVYTPALDKLNRDTLAAGRSSSCRCDRHLAATGINGRLGVQENPCIRAHCCAISAAARWKTIGAVHPYPARCGPLTPISEVVVHDGKPSRCPNQADGRGRPGRR
ncbi:hypothetical protein I551_8865 [Mycobacterium ulcerans str. Harvey]|uniref:Uncharacterized protein n=1 Tax=Mycobacterium ulcerans str. Harvey TaxID=1299332 RepID=A0ABN0R9W1_MYCUL|nr:hypothetical protein I551_8865 [Mycobacterium ulcerans str. Harvey]